MTSEVQVYQHPTFGSIRMFEDDGEIIAVATDLAHALGYRDAMNMIRSLDEDEFRTHTVRTKKGDREVYVVTEPGLYHAISMRKDSCIKDPATRETVVNFQRWLTHEVLPSICKTGAYVNPLGHQMDDEEGMALLSKAVVFAERKIAVLAAENEAMRPMAALGEAVSASPDCIDVGAMARILRQNGCDWGRNDLFKRLREDGYLMDRGANHNVPYQRWINQGLFEVQEQTYPVDGEIRVRLKTMVTPKGQAYLLRRYAGVETLTGLESGSESEMESESEEES